MRNNINILLVFIYLLMLPSGNASDRGKLDVNAAIESTKEIDLWCPIVSPIEHWYCEPVLVVTGLPIIRVSHRDKPTGAQITFACDYLLQNILVSVYDASLPESITKYTAQWNVENANEGSLEMRSSSAPYYEVSTSKNTRNFVLAVIEGDKNDANFNFNLQGIESEISKDYLFSSKGSSPYLEYMMELCTGRNFRIPEISE